MSDNVTSSTSCLNWEAGHLPKEWRTFQTHVELMFNRPLKSKSEEEKCNYLIIWVVDKVREVCASWTLTENERKSL